MKESEHKTAERKDWSIPDERGIIDVPDELMALFNKVATQIRFHTISGKGEVLTVAHIVQHAESFAQSQTQLLREDNERLKQLTDRLDKALNNGRHYLMGVPSNEATVEDALEAFGFGRNGLQNP